MESNRNRLYELDALRGLAALAVLFFHYTTRYETIYEYIGRPMFEFPHGYLGVQLFFMISGFVIFLTLDKTERPLDFVVSRFSRIYPAYWVCVLLTVLGIFLFGLPGKEPGVWQTVINMTMLQQLFLVKDVDGVYWTLLVELMFYGAMYMLFLTGLLRRVTPVLLVWLSVAALDGLLEAYTRLRVPYSVETLLNLKYIPYFALGIIFYQRWKAGSYARDHLLVMLVSLAVIAISKDALTGIACVIFSVIFHLFVNGKLTFLTARPLLYVGAISYPLYLLHENIGFAVIHRLTAANVDINISIGLAILLALALATLVSRYVEIPAMRWIRAMYRERVVSGRQVDKVGGRL